MHGRRHFAIVLAAFAFALATLAACMPATVVRAQEAATSAGTGEAEQTGDPQPTGQSAGDHMRVGAPERPPFASRPGEASWQGIAVDLWRMIAEDLGVTYEIVPVPAEELPQALAAGQIDVALAVNATPGIEALIDLTAPLYTSTLAVASLRKVVLWDVASNVLSIEFLQVMISLSVLLLVVGAIVWLLERKQNSKEFHTRPLLGLGDGFWWAGVTLTTIGYGDKAPKTLFGRAVAMVWMLIGLAVSAALTAAVVSATNIEGSTGLRIPQDLAERRVGAVEGSSAAGYLSGEAVAVEVFPNLAQAMAALDDGRVDAVADGYAAIRMATAGLGDSVVISTSPRDPQYIALGIRQPVTAQDMERANRLRAGVLRHITGDGWWRLLQRYLPTPSDRGNPFPGFD